MELHVLGQAIPLIKYLLDNQPHNADSANFDNDGKLVL